MSAEPIRASARAPAGVGAHWPAFAYAKTNQPPPRAHPYSPGRGVCGGFRDAKYLLAKYVEPEVGEVGVLDARKAAEEVIHGMRKGEAKYLKRENPSR